MVNSKDSENKSHNGRKSNVSLEQAAPKEAIGASQLLKQLAGVKVVWGVGGQGVGASCHNDREAHIGMVGEADKEDMLPK